MRVARRLIPAQLTAPLKQVLRLRAVGRRFVVRNFGELVVGDRQIEAVAKLLESLDFLSPGPLVRAQLTRNLNLRQDFFLLMSGVGPLAADPRHAVAFDRLGQDDRRLAAMLDCGLVSRIDLDGIVAAARQPFEFFIRYGIGNFLQFRTVEELFTNEGAVLGHKKLIVAVNHLAHALDEGAVVVAGQQRVPGTAPNDLDDVPTRAAERAFEFLNDLAVSANRSVQPLQVAIDDPDEIVEPLARRKANRTQRLRFIALAIAQKCPDPAGIGVRQPAILKVAIVARLVDRHDRAEAHAYRGELPETGHQPRMRITRQPAAGIQFLAKVLQLLFGQAAFEKRAGVHARAGVPLEINDVAGAGVGAAAEEMIEADFVERRRRGKCRDVTANVGRLVRLVNDGHRVPADRTLDPPLQIAVARIRWLLVNGNRVDVRCDGR